MWQVRRRVQPHRKRPVEGEAPVRLGVSPRHRREDAPNRTHVRPGAHEHGHYRGHDGLLQEHARRHLLAMAQPVVQRRRQLHQQERRRRHQRQVRVVRALL